MELKEKLLNIQMKLKAPKGQYNDYGKYSYRSCEDILEAVKPILEEYKTVMTIKDEIVQIGEKYFIKSTALLQDLEGHEYLQNEAYAEIGEHKGMTSEQTTGTCSSYCRKYCLNGLFLIDDTKDADTNEFKKQTEKPEKKKETYRDKLIKLCKETKANMNEIAFEYNLTPESKEEDYKKVYETLEGKYK